MSIDEKEYKLIGHSLGVNTYHAEKSQSKRDKNLPNKYYRNHFCAGRINDDAVSEDHQVFIELCKKGLAVRFDKFDNINYAITEKGIGLFECLFNDKMSDFKTTKSKQEYQDFLHSDTGLGFDEWLGIQLPDYEYCNGRFGKDYGQVRMVSTKYDGVKGDWCKNKKLAKASYKEALKRFKNDS